MTLFAPKRFTPGPWAVVGTVAGGPVAVGIIGQAYPPVIGFAGLSDEFTVATIPYLNDESPFNASLLAAAPELLETLEETTGVLELAIRRGLGGSVARNAVERARAIREKSTLRTPYAPRN